MSDDNSNEFQWDYSYFKWQDIPRDVRRQMVLDRSLEGRTSMCGRTSDVMDVPKKGARQMYNHNWDGCRDLWKENYRRSKLRRFYTDHPITPPDPERLQYERQYREHRQAEADRFNHAQQKRYEQWLKKRKAVEKIYGEGYRRWLTTRGRSDLLGLVDNTHSAETRAALNARYEATYGDPGTGRPERGTGAAERAGTLVTRTTRRRPFRLAADWSAIAARQAAAELTSSVAAA
jgi:hypothetical protein